MDNTFAGLDAYDFTYCFHYIFYPIGFINPIKISTDKFDIDPTVKLTGLSDSQTASKILDTAPTNIRDISISAVNNRHFLNREFIGIKAEIKLVINKGAVIYTRSVLTGIIGQITLKGTQITIEIVPDNEKMSTTNPYIISSNCMNSLGTMKCTLSKGSLVFSVNAVSDNTITINGLYPFIVNQQYQLIVGHDPYIINTTLSDNINPQTITTDRDFISKPDFLTIERYCNRTLAQCRLYNNAKQFNGNTFLQTSAINLGN